MQQERGRRADIEQRHPLSAEQLAAHKAEFLMFDSVSQRIVVIGASDSH
jgi:hypothetical protein